MNPDDLFGALTLALLIGVISYPLWRGSRSKRRWARICEDRRKHWFK